MTSNYRKYMNSSVKHKKSKKKLLICSIAVVLLIAVTLTLLFACGNKGTPPVIPDDTKSVRLVPPEDGSLPEDHTNLENIGYLAGRLASRSYYHAENVGTVQTNMMGVKQEIVGSKDYKDGILIVESISVSNSSLAPSKAQQRYIGEDKAIVRGAASGDKSDWNGLDTEWSTGDPTVYDKEGYENKYGMWPTELTDYIVNENTITDYSDLTVADGVYSLTVSLDTKSSVYYYINQMKTMGDLPKDSWPTFYSIQITFEFTADWTLLSYTVQEEYQTYKAGFNADCTGTNAFTFSYEEADADVSAYKEYFEQYADADVTGGGEEDAEYTAADYLGLGFASFLQGETSLQADLTINGTPVSAQVLLSMGSDASGGILLNSIKANLGSLAFSYGGGQIYLSYKDFIGKISEEDLQGLLGGTSLSGLFGELDMAALMDQLGGGTIAKDGGKVALSCELTLGDFKLPLTFGFTEMDGEVSFDYISAEISLSDISISANVTLAEEPVTVSIDTEKAVDLKPFAQNILALAEGKRFEISLSYSNESIGLSLEEGSITVDLSSGFAAEGAFTLRYAGLKIPVAFTWKEDVAYIRIYGISVKAGAAEIKDAVAAILESTGTELPEANIDLGSLISALLTLDYDSVISELSLTSEGLALAVDLDGLLFALTGEESALGELRAEYTAADNAFTLNVMGAVIGIRGSDEEVAVPEGEYISLSRLLAFVTPVEEIAASKDAAFTASLSTALSGVKIRADLTGEIRFAEQSPEIWLKAEVFAGDGNRITAYIIYDSAGILLQIGDVKAQLKAEDLSKVLEKLTEGDAGNTALEALSALTEKMDLNAFLESLALAAQGENALKISMNLAALLGEDFGEGEFTVSSEGGRLSVIAVKPLQVSGIVLDGLSVSAWSGAGENTFAIEGAVDVWPLIESAEKLLSSDGFKIAVGYENEDLSLKVSGTLLATVRPELALQGSLSVTFADLQIPVTFVYTGGENAGLWLTVCNLRVHADQSELDSLIASLQEILSASASGLTDTAALTVSDILAEILQLDLSAILEDFSLTESGFGLTVDLDALLNALTGQTSSYGDVVAEYDLAESEFRLTVMGASVALSSSEHGAILPPEEEYLSLSVLLDLVNTAKQIASSDDLAFGAEFTTALLEVPMRVSVGGEIKFAAAQDTGVRALSSVYLILEFSRVGAELTHRVEILYDGSLTLAYGGYKMTFTKDDLSEVLGKIEEKFGKADTYASEQLADLQAIVSFLKQNAQTLQKLIDSLEISAAEGGMNVAADLSALIQGMGGISLDVTVKDGEISVRSLKEIAVSGISLQNLSARLFVAENEYAADLGGYKVCNNVFEFILNGYTKLFGSEFVALNLAYTEGDLSVALDGRLQLASNETDSTVVFNLDFAATIVQGGSANYLHLVILEDQLWLSYSVKGLDAENALRVTMPVSDLFVAGGTILPILAPILGITEDAYYYDFVNVILGEAYETINSGIFGEVSIADWVGLILDILDEYGVIGGDPSATAPSDTASADQVADIAITESNGVWSLAVVQGGMDLSLSTSAGEGAEIVQPSGNYLDGSSLAQLLKDVLRAYDYANPEQGYYLSGTINLNFDLKIDLGLGSLSLAEHQVPVQIDLRIGFDENQNPHIYIKVVSLKNVYEVFGLIPVTIINADTTTEIAIKDGNIYMRRTTPEETEVEETTVAYSRRGYKFGDDLLKNYYNIVTQRTERDYSVQCRSMRLSSLLQEGMQSLMEQLYFVLNLSDTVQGVIPGFEDTSLGSGESSYDIGEMVNGYTYSDNVYSLNLNLAALANNTDLGSLNISIARNGEGELLSLNGKMTMLKNIITLSFDFEHVSPGEDSQGKQLCDEVIAYFAENGLTVPEQGVNAEKIYTDVRVTCSEGTASYYKTSDSWANGSYVLENGEWLNKNWRFDSSTGTVIVG